MYEIDTLPIWNFSMAELLSHHGQNVGLYNEVTRKNKVGSSNPQK